MLPSIEWNWKIITGLVLQETPKILNLARSLQGHTVAKDEYSTKMIISSKDF